jgi:hypothetical protein
MPRRPNPAKPTLAPKKNLSVSEMQRGIERVTERLQEVSDFSLGLVRSAENPPELTGLETSIERTIARIFGENTPDYERYKAAARLRAVFMAFSDNYPAVQHYREQIAANIETSKQLLRDAIRALEDDVADVGGTEPVTLSAVNPEQREHPTKVFVVHGHGGFEHAVAGFLRKLGLDPNIFTRSQMRGEPSLRNSKRTATLALLWC